MPGSRISVFGELGFEGGFGFKDFRLESISHLVPFLVENLYFLIAAVKEVLEFVDFPVEEVALVGMSVFEECDFGFLDSFHFFPEVVEFEFGDVFGFDDFVLQLIVFLFQDVDGILVVVPNLGVLVHDLVDFPILRINHFLQLRVLVVQSVDLIHVLLLQVFYLRMEVVLELCLQTLHFLLVLGFLIKQVVSQSILFFPQLPYFKIGLLVQPHDLHVQVANFVVLLITVFLQFPDFQLVFFRIAQVPSFHVLNFKVLLVFQLVDLEILYMLDFTCFLLQLFNLVEEPLDFEF